MGNSSAPSRSAAAAELTAAEQQQWRQHQQTAARLRDRLQLSLARMSTDDARHGFLQQMQQQLQRLADLPAGTVALSHFAVSAQVSGA